MPHQLGRYFQAVQPVLVDRKQTLLAFTEVVAQGNRLVGPPPRGELPEALDFGIAQSDQRVQLREQGIQVAGALDHDRQREARPVIRQQHAIAVEDQPAWRGYGAHMDPVAIGAGDEILVAEHLQIEVTPDQNHQHHRHGQQGEHQPAGKQQVLVAVIAQQTVGCAHRW